MLIKAMMAQMIKYINKHIEILKIMLKEYIILAKKI